MNYFRKGRRCGVPGAGRPLDPNSKAGQKRAKKWEAERAQREENKRRSEAAANEFIHGEKCRFSYYDFVFTNENNWDDITLPYVCEEVFLGESDDCGLLGVLEVGGDGFTVYGPEGLDVNDERLKEKGAYKVVTSWNSATIYLKRDIEKVVQGKEGNK